MIDVGAYNAIYSIGAPHPRPVTRIPPPQTLNNYHNVEERWAITEELLAEYERDSQSGLLKGTVCG